MKVKKYVGIAGLAGLIAAGGSAFTDANTVPATVLGVGSGAVSGVTVTSVSYTLNANGTTINAVTMVLSGDTTGSTIKIGFNHGAVAVCSGAGVFATNTTYVCSGLTQDVALTTSFEVVAV